MSQSACDAFVAVLHGPLSPYFCNVYNTVISVSQSVALAAMFYVLSQNVVKGDAVKGDAGSEATSASTIGGGQSSRRDRRGPSPPRRPSGGAGPTSLNRSMRSIPCSALGVPNRCGVLPSWISRRSSKRF